MNPEVKLNQQGPDLKIDDAVYTPAGSIATVMVVYVDLGEALVVWPAGDRARFRLSQLRHVAPGAVDQRITPDSIT